MVKIYLVVIDLRLANRKWVIRVLVLIAVTIQFSTSVCLPANADTAIPSEGFILKDRIAEGEFQQLFTLDEYGIQGGCYTEEGRYVICFSSSTSNNLILKCLDSNTMQFLWSVSINEGKHGNAICFRPADRCLYIADCFSYDSRSVLDKTISVVDYDHPEAGVIETIVSPARGGIYSIAYDREADTFYSINYRGTVEGDANALFSYDGVFESVRQMVCLDDFSARFVPAHSSQGVQCIADGIAYVPYYAPEPIVAGYDLYTGKLLFAEKIPKSIGGSKIGELESVLYNEDSKNIWILTSKMILQYADEVTGAQRVYSALSRYIAKNYRLN